MSDRDAPGCMSLAPLFVVLVACAIAVATAGCGASVLRSHATAATVAHAAVESAGTAIVAACDSTLAACHDEACIGATGAQCELAAASRDALVLPVEAYRDGVLAAAADDGRVEALLDLAIDVGRAWPAFAAALAVLGVDVPNLEVP